MNLKKLSAGILLVLSSHAYAADDIGLCRYDLAGPTVMPDTIHEKNHMSLSDCKKAAWKMLLLNKESYDTAIVRHEKHPKSIVLSLKDKNE